MDSHDLPGPFRATCPTRGLLDQIADKWSVLVLIALKQEPHRFNALRRRIEGVSQKVLTQVLRRLEHNGLVLRAIGSGTPAPVTYSLTPLGASLAQLMEELRRWAIDNIAAVASSRKQDDQVSTDMLDSASGLRDGLTSPGG